ncbi:hypothetical protein B566_EDAN004973 [Ephemera danica]|nr:hypothetical protein B566_EDAN004973 [Ephemera danica]
MALNNIPLKEHVCDLPYLVNEELCHLLNENNNWEELAGVHMRFTMDKIRAIRRDSRESSPAQRLMDLCSQRNVTIYELFLNLCKMQLHQATLLLKPYVAEKYHVLIKEASDAPPSELDLKLTQALMVQNLRTERSKDFNLVNNFNSKQLCDKNKLSQLNYQKSDNLSIEADLMKFSGELAAATTMIQNPNKQSGNNSGDTSSEFNPEIASNNNHIPYDELCLATNFWDKNNILGRGGFGTVFRGHWKKTEVAIKRIEQRKSSDRGGKHTQQVDQLYKELKFLNSLRQDNILPLYGFSLDSEQPCLICQLMPNGSLQDRIHRKNNTAPLSWQIRLSIALGTARGLQFLHTRYEKPLIHGDIKSANILLDADWTPRIGDFGLALEGPIANYTHLTVTSIHGTRPYLPLDFLRSKQASTKVDTYSFGIVLFEIVTGLWAHEKNRKPELLRDLMQSGDLRHHMDPNAPFDLALGPHVFHGLVTLGQQCTANLARDRPDMTSVFLDLEKLQVTEQNLPGIATASTNYTITMARPERTKAPRNAEENRCYLTPIPEQRSSLADSPRLLTPVPNSTQNLISFSPNLGNSPQPVETSSQTAEQETTDDFTASQEVDSVFVPATIKSMENHNKPEPGNSDSGDLPNLSILGV